MFPITFPWIITWEPISLLGFRRTGFMWIEGSIPQASACMAWARPISPPSLATAELRAIFWALNGATLYPIFLNILQSPAVIMLLPTWEPVPWTIIALAMPQQPFVHRLHRLRI